MLNPEYSGLYGDSGTKVSPEDFELEEVPKELQGLTSQTLFKMYDQVTKWGDAYGETGKSMDVYNPQAGWGIHVSASPFTKMMAVIKIDESGIAETTQGFFPLKPKVGVVLWDRRLTVDEAVEALAAQDTMARRAGYINEKAERLYKGHNN